MSDDCRLHGAFFDHPKTIKLERKAGAKAVICFQRLWIFCSKVRTDGKLTGMGVEDIEIAANWDGDPGLFVRSLCEVNYLDGVDFEYEIHDWEEHQPYVFATEARVAKSVYANHVKWHSEKPNDNCWICQKGAGLGPDQSPKSKSGTPKSKCRNPPPALPPFLPPSLPSENIFLKPENKKPKKPKAPHPETAKAEQVADYYRSVNPGSGRALKPGHKDFKLILARLAEGFEVDDLCKAVDGNRLDEWHVTNRKHSAEYVFRNTTKVEDFIKVAENGPPGKSSPDDEWDESYRKLSRFGQERGLGCLTDHEYWKMRKKVGKPDKIAEIANEMTVDPDHGLDWSDVFERGISA